MTGDKWVGYTCLVAFGFLIGISLPSTEAKTYDEIKAERLAMQRDLRRANERKYEACMTTCREGCGK